MRGLGDELQRRQDAVERDGMRWASHMTDAEWISEGKCPRCWGEGFIGRHDCLACGGTGEVVRCSVCDKVIEHGLIIRRGADKLHPECSVETAEEGVAS
jgi:RecJ-like exonuclease